MISVIHKLHLYPLCWMHRCRFWRFPETAPLLRDGPERLRQLPLALEAPWCYYATIATLLGADRRRPMDATHSHPVRVSPAVLGGLDAVWLSGGDEYDGQAVSASSSIHYGLPRYGMVDRIFPKPLHSRTDSGIRGRSSVQLRIAERPQPLANRTRPFIHQ